jgi:DNA-binding MarR family transcriptional regulator
MGIVRGGPVEGAAPDDATAELQRRLVAFVRAFGLHKGDETPCGAAVPVSEAHALAVLTEFGSISQNVLSRHLRLRKSTVSRLVDQLEQKRWVRRAPVPGDGRQRMVVLTAEGQNVADGIRRRRAARMADLLARIPEGQRAVVLAALDTLVEAADAE